MATITLGSAAINRTGHGGGTFTVVNKGNPAGASGTIDTFEIYAYTDLTGVEIASFYVVSGDNLSTRSTHSIGNVSAGYQKFTGLSLAVEAGDYIGVYVPGVGKDYDKADSGGSGYWYLSGDYVPCTNQAFSVLGSQIVSFGASGSTPSASGIKSLVGVGQAAIKSVCGVAEAGVKSVGGVSN